MPPKTLLLLGAGHSHVQVIPNLPPLLSKSPESYQIILISDATTSTYSGMLPSVIAGLATPQDSAIDLQPLCRNHGIAFIQAQITHIDIKSQLVHIRKLNTRITLNIPYDILSINMGSRTKPMSTAQPLISATSQIPIVVYTRPIQNLSAAIDKFANLTQFHPPTSHPIVIIGAGAAGIELSFCLSSRFPHHQISLVSNSKRFHSQYGWLPAHHIQSHLRSRNIQTLYGKQVIAINREKRLATLSTGEQLPFALVVLATGAAPHPLLTKIGLPLDPSDWLLVQPTLQSPPHPNIFASGDCVAFGSLYPRNFPPKAGVYAVRQGPVLTHNISVALLNRGTMKTFTPQASFLSLLTTGDGRAIGTKYGIVFSGNWVYRLKMFIDEAWLDRFRKRAKAVESTLSREVWTDGVVEGAAVLGGGDQVQIGDCFDRQLAVLKRMDEDEAFRESILEILQAQRNDMDREER